VLLGHETCAATICPLQLSLAILARPQVRHLSYGTSNEEFYDWLQVNIHIYWLSICDYLEHRRNTSARINGAIPVPCPLLALEIAVAG
jgi:hypothetical protein